MAAVFSFLYRIIISSRWGFSFNPPSSQGWTVNRKQFSIRPAYAISMIFNASQGLVLLLAHCTAVLELHHDSDHFAYTPDSHEQRNRDDVHYYFTLVIKTT